MKKIDIRRKYYKLKHDYFTLNNAVTVAAFIIASSWIWGSMMVMQRNFNLQKELDDKNRQLIIAELDTANARLEQRYYKTNEYKELAVREKLGLADPGESVLILPQNSEEVKKADKAFSTKPSSKPILISNFGQWINFLFGGNSKSISK